MEIVKFINNLSELDPIPLGLLLITFAMFIIFTAVKIMRFDISDFVEKRHQRKQDKWRRRAQSACPHCLFWSDDSGRIWVQGTFVSPSGTTQIICERCGVVLNSWRIVHALTPYLPQEHHPYAPIVKKEVSLETIDFLIRKNEEFAKCVRKLNE